MKTIGIPFNPPAHGQPTGVERYVFELLRALMDIPIPVNTRIELYSATPLTIFGELPDGWTNVVLPWRLKGWTHMRLSWFLCMNPPDALFIPAHEIPYRTSRKTKIIATVHDLAFAIVPEVYPPKERKRQWWALRQLIKRSAHILAVSQSTKQDLMSVAQVPEEKITVTPLAATRVLARPNPEVQRKTLQEFRLRHGQYIIFVGRLEYKKGILELLRIFDAYKRAQGIGDPLQLVLVGKYGFGEAEIKRLLGRLARHDIHILGYVNDTTLSCLLNGARGFIFPTRYEGFGMPLLEAMQLGIPVLTTDLPVTREVAGVAALYAPANDVASWLRIMQQLLRNEDVSKILIEAGKIQYQKFTWEETAKITATILFA